MKTKFLVRFLNRLVHLDADLEMADVFKIAITTGKLNSPGDPHLFHAVNPQQHPILATRGTGDGSRNLAANHLKTSLYGSFIKDIYEETTGYMRDLLNSAASMGINPNRLIGEHKVSFEANDILQTGGWLQAVRMVSDSVFRKLQNEKSTRGLIQKMNDKLDLGVQQTTIDEALPYLEIRHLLIHQDGLADKAYCEAHPDFGATEGQKIQLDYVVMKKARDAILALVTEFDQRAIAGNVVLADDQQP